MNSGLAQILFPKNKSQICPKRVDLRFLEKGSVMFHGQEVEGMRKISKSVVKKGRLANVLRFAEHMMPFSMPMLIYFKRVMRSRKSGVMSCWMDWKSESTPQISFVPRQTAI